MASMLHSTNNGGYTMLHCASQQGHTELVQIVIEELKLDHTAQDKVCVIIHSCLDLARKVCLC